MTFGCMAQNKQVVLLEMGQPVYFFMSDFNFFNPLLTASAFSMFSCLQYADIISADSLSSRTVIFVFLGLSVGLPILGDNIYHLHLCLP